MTAHDQLHGVCGPRPDTRGNGCNHELRGVSIVRREAEAILSGLRAMDRQREPVSLAVLFDRASKEAR